MQSDGEKTDPALKSSAINMHSSELPFKSWPSAVYTGHLILAQKDSSPLSVAAVIRELTGIL